MTFIACGRTQPEPAKVFNEFSANNAPPRLNSPSDVQRVVTSAATAERAILFIHVDWAPMTQQRTRFDDYVSDYQHSHPQDDLAFYYVDCTSITESYAPLKRLAGWKELEGEAGTSLIHGYGELVWMEQGRVVHVERILNFESTSELLQKTEALIPDKRRG
jgi:hypothetical protein